MVTTLKEARAKAKYVEVVGQIEYAVGGSYNVWSVRGVYMPRGATWEALVAAAVAQLREMRDKYWPDTTWYVTDHYLSEIPCTGCVTALMNGGFGPPHDSRCPGKNHCTCDSCF